MSKALHFTRDETKPLSWFFMPFLLFFLLLSLLCWCYSQAELHLLLNAHHTPFWDSFFKYYTHFGGPIPWIAVLLLVCYERWLPLLGIATLTLNVLLTNGMKLFFGHDRPLLYFEKHYPDVVLPLVEGIQQYTHNGFPSGHTSAVFACATLLALIFKRWWTSLLAFLIAALTGYSRIYLSQHFPKDILLGSLIGVLVASACYALAIQWYQKRQKRLTEKMKQQSIEH